MLTNHKCVTNRRVRTEVGSKSACRSLPAEQDQLSVGVGYNSAKKMVVGFSSLGPYGPWPIEFLEQLPFTHTAFSL
jgi:hypothetical protein